METVVTGVPLLTSIVPLTVCQMKTEVRGLTLSNSSSADGWGLPFPVQEKVTVLSGTSFMLCGQAQQPVGRGPNFLLRDPGAKDRTNLLAQQRTTPCPSLVGVARAA